MRGQRGNISLILMAATVLLFIFFLVLFDVCRIFVAREETKNASDSAVLAASQNLLYFDKDQCRSIAGEVVKEYGCSLIYLEIGYDEIEACAEKELNLFIAHRFVGGDSRVRSVSRSRVIYPWDWRFNYCEYYKFDFRRQDE
ncbi:MAG: pilus assembly protein TadG-related protein [Actinomycetota bacterium]